MLGLGIGPTFGGYAASVTVAADFTAPALGAASMPSGATFARSGARFLRTGLTTMANSSGSLLSLSANTGGIGRVLDSDATKGLWIEPAATNLLPFPRGPFSSWSGTGTGTLTTGLTGPDGLASATRVAASASSRGLWSQNVAKSANTAIPWFWIHAGTIADFQGVFYWGREYIFGGSGVLPASWQVMQAQPQSLNITSGTSIVALGECYASGVMSNPAAQAFYLGGGAAQTNALFSSATAQNFIVWSASLEENAAYSTTYCDTTRSGEGLSFPASQVVGGRFIFEATFTPQWSSAMIANAIALGVSVPNPALWYRDPLAYCEIAWEHTGAIRCVVEGVPVVFPTIPPWAYGVPITVHVEGGNGAASGWYSTGSGQVSLGAESTTQLPMQAAGTVNLFSQPGSGSGPTNQIGATVQSFKLSRLG